MDGMITEIQRFCLTDGPGIRTTVFFKGCNLRCAWCHNPETLEARPDLLFYEMRCIGCGKCFKACPAGAHVLNGGRHAILRDVCSRCGKCADVCSAEALIMSGRSVSVEDVMREVLQDRAYYRDSGGGVTLSGGEVLCQREFAAALADACRAEEIEVGIETNLLLPFEEMEPLLEKMDLVMLDVKLLDEAAHKEWTGAGNRLILDNVRKIDQMGVPFLVRTPLVPGVTDLEENLRATLEFLKPLKNLLYYELLNFNPLGGSKYKNMGLDYPFEKTKPFDRQRMEAFASALSGGGVTVKTG